MAERRVTMFKKKLGFLLGVMLLLSLIGCFACLAAGGSKKLNTENKYLLVTSFYPMYILAQNLTEGIEEIEVVNLTENRTGCLHDYQLTSRDMKLLSRADAFLINGAGMELFMEKVLENNEELKVIDASEGIPLLEASEHQHDHEAEHTEEETEPGHEAEAEHEHSENGHVWMNPDYYWQQVDNVCKQLVRIFPEQGFDIAKNATRYGVHVLTLGSTCDENLFLTKGKYVVSFHEGFAYFAERLGMEVIATISLDEETLPSAGEIAEVIEEIKYHGQAVIFIEEMYKSHAEKIVAETGAEVIYLDPLTTGDGNLRSYLDGMRLNIEAVGMKSYHPE